MFGNVHDISYLLLNAVTVGEGANDRGRKELDHRTDGGHHADLVLCSAAIAVTTVKTDRRWGLHKDSKTNTEFLKRPWEAINLDERRENRTLRFFRSAFGVFVCVCCFKLGGLVLPRALCRISFDTTRLMAREQDTIFDLPGT